MRMRWALLMLSPHIVKLLRVQLPAIADDVDLPKGDVCVAWHRHVAHVGGPGLLLLLLLCD